MKKIHIMALAVLAAMSVASCKKDVTAEKPAEVPKLIRIESVDLDGQTMHSPVVVVN